MMFNYKRQFAILEVLFLFNLLRQQAEFSTYVSYLLSILLIIFLVTPLHEWAHAFAASKLGDKSIKYRGRLTLNPMAHLDYMGAIFMLLFGFGWAKPVPVDDRYFKNPKVGMAITALAGPLSNILAAFVGGFLYCGVVAIVINTNPILIVSGTVSFILELLGFFISVNCTLAVFNLIPWPPLDGSKILFAFLPDKWINLLYQYQQYFYFVLMGLLLFTNVLTGPLNSMTSWLLDMVMTVCEAPFGGLLYL